LHSSFITKMILLLTGTIALAFVHVVHGATPLKVCSFNVQIFGDSKVQKADVMSIVTKIFQRYDLCLIMEIRSTTDNAINKLLAAINDGKDTYGLVLSDRLGRSNSKEQYGFFYNKKKIQIKNKMHFDDKAAGDIFEREPFLVHFHVATAAVPDFFIGGIHTSAEKAVQEIGDLVKVYDQAIKKFKLQEGIIMGDYNAGCGYFPKKDWAANPFRKDPRFLWLIGDDIDTTVGKADCAYDRVVVGGKNLQKHVKNTKTYFYDREYKVDATLVKRVSDHYPVEFVIG